MSPSQPTPRAVLTSLINSLTTTTLPPLPQPSSNPLKSLPQSQRPILVTLHVLFPSLVLPALDLLDRNLVTRVVKVDALPYDTDSDTDDDNQVPDADPAIDPAADQHYHHHHQPSSPSNSDDQDANDQDEATAVPNRDEPAAFHLVRSVASTFRRNQSAAMTTSTAATYLVQLDAWNCTCANFAFEAFPAAAAASESDLEILGAGAAEDEIEVSPDWQFGGLSLDGEDSGGVPCCKHLLACLLAEQWCDVLGSYALEKRLDREEIAGTIGDL
ncbi:ubiquitin carboxyl-terminal hydrolase family protein [Colletotrichum camelliae]|nr:ubiquitin carboxyl-terminal hydrolase family protein [Colletotrichum camelliae]